MEQVSSWAGGTEFALQSWSAFSPATRQDRPATRASEAAAVYNGPSADVVERRRARTLIFRSLCNRANALIMPALHAGAAVEAAVDLVFDDPEWMREIRAYSAAGKELPRPPLQDDTLRRLFPWADKLSASPPSRATARRVLTLVNATSHAHRNLDLAHVTFKGSLPESAYELDELAFLADPGLPVALRHGVLSHRHAMVAIFATFPSTVPNRMVLNDFRCVLALLKFAATELCGYLGVLANIPAARVSVVPADGRDLTPPPTPTDDPFATALWTSEVDAGQPA